MIQPDTIKLINNSSKVMQDSLAKLDSIQMIDSLRIADSLKVAVKVSSGFIGTPHPSIPQTESWVFIVLLLLFLFFVYSFSQSTGFISDTIKNFFQVKERSSIFSKATVNDSRFRFFNVVFAVGVISFYAYLIFCQPLIPFSIKKFGLFLLITGLFLGIKFVVFDLIGYVFLNPVILKIGKDAYFNIISLFGVVIFPILVLQIYIPENFINITRFLSLFVSAIIGILLLIKLFQVFFRKLLASFYIFLYLCTLEILPLILLYKVYKLIALGI